MGNDESMYVLAAQPTVGLGTKAERSSHTSTPASGLEHQRELDGKMCQELRHRKQDECIPRTVWAQSQEGLWKS